MKPGDLVYVSLTGPKENRKLEVIRDASGDSVSVINPARFGWGQPQRASLSPDGRVLTFATLLDGYSVTEGLRPRIPLLNKLSREDIFTGPSVFQLLPHRVAARFLDENLKPIEIDLYDPKVWRQYGWSPVNDPDYRRRFVKGETRGDDAPFHAGTLADLDAYFVLVLNRAKRFHEALDVSDVFCERGGQLAGESIAGE